MSDITITQNDKNADLISSLPTNENQPRYEELKIMDTLFKKHTSSITKIVNEFKDGFVLSVFFILFSIPFVDELFKKYVPYTCNSLYILIFIKSILFMLAVWIFKNLVLLKK
jgi:hypothetical protein